VKGSNLCVVEGSFTAQVRLDYQKLFDASPDVLLVLLPDAPRFTMVAATEERLRVTHTTREATLGRGLFEIFPDNPDDPEATGTSNLRASLERVIATLRADTMAVQKYDIRGPDGSFEAKYWSPKNIPVLSPTGELQYILHRVEDVTELVQASELGQELRDRTHQMEREVLTRSRELAEANASLREANAKLGELDRAKTAFFSNVSHEFRTPLTLILGSTERAVAEGEPLPVPDLMLVHRNALRLLRLVNNLLDFSRMEAGRLEGAFAPVDLSQLTSGIASGFRSLFEAVGLQLNVDCPPLPEPIYVDTSQWEKVVMNLVSNAFKFTLQGSVSVQLQSTGDGVELAVRDTGTGIAQHELARVFERFHRVEGARGRSFEGSGVGLALVHEIVRQHGGAVRVESSLDEGTTFFVSLKAGTAHLPQARIVEASGVAAGEHPGADAALVEARQWLRSDNESLADEPPHSAAAEKILIADDNPDMREYLQRLLSPHWQTEVVTDGKAALAAALASAPDLVLSDVMMPEMDGVQLLGALRADPRTQTLPVILISARAGEEARLAGLETGADDYIVKPFAAREVLTRIRTHLEMAKVRRAAAAALHELAETRAGLLLRLEQEHTQLQATHDELKRTQAQLVHSAKMASLGELVAGIAHEINNPLAFGSSHLVTVQRGLDAVGKHVASTIPAELSPTWERAVARLAEVRMALGRIGELVLKLRTFSRLDEGEQKRIDVRESIASVLTILGHRLNGRIRVTTDVDTPQEIDCYASLFNQAVMNLVANAIDAIEQEGAIAISSRVHDGWFELHVGDTGSGIPDHVRARVFEPFFTTKAPGEGTGLGLSITHSIAQKHGGTIELSARDGGGTLAKLRFPLTG
jgi:signal transduction histidine kinase